jgi:hypothetical protein
LSLIPITLRASPAKGNTTNDSGCIATFTPLTIYDPQTRKTQSKT